MRDERRSDLTKLYGALRKARKAEWPTCTCSYPLFIPMACTGSATGRSDQRSDSPGCLTILQSSDYLGHEYCTSITFLLEVSARISIESGIERVSTVFTIVLIQINSGLRGVTVSTITHVDRCTVQEKGPWPAELATVHCCRHA